ncbi:threonine synthase [Niabella terrae]
MQYYSLNHQSPVVSFKEAAILGQAPDKGLYFPAQLPQVDAALIRDIGQLSAAELGFRVMRPYVAGSLPDEVLHQIVAETINFPIPLVSVTSQMMALELFHGPTLAFKDVGARFMSRCLGYFLRDDRRTVTVLVATSGDTGGAVANGFHGVENVNVVILYPRGRVSPVQEKQLTTLGENITALEINGSFDDCQRMVKQAFADQQVREQCFLTSANSINIARWLPQQIYYFLAYQQWENKSQAPVVCVPSGNFGNICAGLLAKLSGLPLGHFIAACNINDVVSEYLRSGSLEPRQTRSTISNAMDVGNPSNFVRIIELFQQQFPRLKESLSAYTVTDDQTRATIQAVDQQFGYTLDPHGAVAYYALDQYLKAANASAGAAGWILETAHPVKFPESVEQATGREIPIPEALQAMMTQEKKALELAPDYEELKRFLLS